MSGADLMVRMGELAVSSGPDDVLTSIGLGSCIGLALVDVDRQVAGLAHVMLPCRPDRTADPAAGKFADTAVPALLDAVLAAGARRPRLATYVVGGAQMFSFGGRGMDVGNRNDQAVREALAALHLRVRAAATGGTNGRTIRVHAADGRVTVKESGGVETPISPAARAPLPLPPSPPRTPLRVPGAATQSDAVPAREASGGARTPLRVPGAATQSDAVPAREASGGARTISTLRGV
ncbi:chemotaxis protein CheD [Patulibacter sp. NPDC049589]|uniref:chemotaxis protein CheD n=1 Tax=Patulibacter sp. NPDC049589 TaxID=3154731 RepID=UPI00342FE64D